MQVFGRFIIADPSVQNGDLVFRGTDVRVADALEQIAGGKTLGTVSEQWGRRIPTSALAEAVRLAAEAFVTHKDETLALQRAKPEHEALGRYIVADPDICHGKLTFRGTRIFVAHVLEQIARGMSWMTIEEEWRRSVKKNAIAEAVWLAREALLVFKDDLLIEPARA
ncbi:MAG: DUF433 domain-containing protein [Chloroflexi bacterium]|nr:DUF433 domain-containing protein [Chloroflexota bacterium]